MDERELWEATPQFAVDRAGGETYTTVLLRGGRLSVWVKTRRESGIEALSIAKGPDYDGGMDIGLDEVQLDKEEANQLRDLLNSLVLLDQIE